MIDYCCVCRGETIHKSVSDKIFDYALECLECHTVWEASPPDSDDKEPMQLELPFDPPVNRKNSERN